MRFALRRTVLAAALLGLAACQAPTPAVDMQTAAMSAGPNNLARRQLQSRRFDTEDERLILQACAGLLQDLGFTLEESEANTGLLVASKDRDATEAGQVAGQLFLVALAAAAGTQYQAVWETNQKIRASVVTTPMPDQAMRVRVTFQRVIWNTQGRVSRVETLVEPVIYREFFDKLAQSVFLEAHEI